MIERLNLGRYYCRLFSVIIHSELRSFAKTLPEDDIDYGLSYKRSQLNHSLAGLLTGPHEDNRFHIQLDYHLRGIGKPPPEYLHPDLLWDIMRRDLQGSFEISVQAEFDFPVENWEQIIEIPREVPEGIAGQLFTHMDRLGFSKRTDGRLEYGVTLHPMTETIPITVRKVEQKEIKRDLLRRLLTQSYRIATMMVTPAEASDGE